MASDDRLWFGDFELRLDSGELFRAGVPVKLQPQPARVLELLVRRSGEVVSREELRRHLWGEDVFVDFEHGLNFSIQQLRRALGDSAAAPRFIETVPKRGYRFIVPVQFEEAAPSLPDPLPQRRQSWPVHAALLILLAVVLVVLPADPRRRIQPPSGVSLAAWTAYEDGRYLAQPENASREDMERAAAAFRQATLLEPAFADAYTDLAKVEMQLMKSPAETFPVVESAARRALEIDPGQTDARLLLARVYFLFHFDLARAEKEVRRILEEDSDVPGAWFLLADLLTARGRHQEALDAVERASFLEAREKAQPDLVCCHYLFLAQRYDEAIRCGERILRLAPESSDHSRLARTWIIWSAWKKGDLETAMATAKAQVRAETLVPPPHHLLTLRDYWNWDLQRVTTLAKTQPLVSTANQAVFRLALGDRNAALDLLERAAARRDSSLLLYLGVDPRWDDLRGDPRFEKLLRRVGYREAKTGT